jgi:hypothetical protein
MEMVPVTPTDLSGHGTRPDAAARDIDDEFVALVYSDEELLRDEFDALIAAAWYGAPPPTAGHDEAAECRPDRVKHDLLPTGGDHRAAVVTAVRDHGARTRAPPVIARSIPMKLTTKGGHPTPG